MKDIKFILQLSILIVLNIALIIVLNFVSFDKKSTLPSKSKEFISKLIQIDEKLQSVEPIQEIKPIKMVVVEKKVISPQIVYKEKKKKVSPTVEKKVQGPIVITSEDSNKNIKKTKSVQKNIIAKLEERFNKTYDYSIAMKISHLYYMKKKYNKSLKWTQIANELNKKDDKSWIMFAKIKIKQGEIDKAKLALKTYLSSYKSKDAYKFLKGLSS